MGGRPSSLPSTDPAASELEGARVMCEERGPSLPAGSLRGRGRGLLTQTVADTELTRGHQRGWREGPRCFLRGDHCAQSHRRPVSGKAGTVPLGELILIANTEPSWQGSEEGEAPPSTARQVEQEGGAGEGRQARFFGWSERA